MTDESYYMLTNAVITQACLDYRYALQNKDVKEIVKIEEFFKSELFNFYSNLDGTYMMKCVKANLKSFKRGGKRKRLRFYSTI